MKYIFTIATAVLAFSLGHISSFFESSVPNRLVKTAENLYALVSEEEKLQWRRQGKNFIDMTNVIPVEDAINAGMIAAGGETSILTFFMGKLDELKRPIPHYKYPENATHEAIVRPLLERIDQDRIRADLAKFTSFYTRYYKSATGLESAEWLHQHVSDIVSILPPDVVSIRKFEHSGWDQFSFAVILHGQTTDKVIVGAHQDSTNLLFPNLLRAPGADDDGSGTVTTVEALRLVVEAIASGDFVPHNTLEFHYYSAEEGGLLGSIDVFTRYNEEGAVVLGMLQQDMTGSTQGSIDAGVEPHFGLINDYTSVHLNNFIKMIVKAYCGIPYHELKCGYACSDHALALENGFPSSFLIESEMEYTSKFIHSVMDTLDRLDFDHIAEHVKLTVGYAVELAQTKKAIVE